MTTRTIYCDEAGFTGYNLLDPAQPVFAVASADVEEWQAEEILKQSFPRYQGLEYKFTNIWASRNRGGLLTFAKHLATLADRSLTYAVDKQFAVLTKIVDHLIEPYVTDAGYDFYADGFCWKYANYIHFGMTKFGQPELFDTLLRRYQEFSRTPTLKNLVALHARLAIMAASAEEQVRTFVEQMELGARLFLKYHNLDRFRGSDELQLATMVTLVSLWRQRHPENFAIIHNSSSNFLRGSEMWERMTSNNVPQQMLRMGDGSFVEYPLRVVSTAPLNSRSSRSIQFCDILAGLATRHFSPRTEGEDRIFMDKVVEAGLREITYHRIGPGSEFPDFPPKPLTGPDIVDQMTEIMFGPHHRHREH